MQNQLIPLNSTPQRFAEVGLPFESINQARWCHRTRFENGFAPAFVNIGARVHIDVPRFHEIARSHAGVAP
jgi:hypothetical protein